ncbi:hypothetical protein BC829DRAFT_419698 [Chytridium lagenaria]|nr:hypothetical protein BC829DRAFT_419698 [Chytridium lagenaria]
MVFKGRRVEFAYRPRSPTRRKASRTVNEVLLDEEIDEDGEQQADGAGVEAAGDDVDVPERGKHQERVHRLEEEIQLLEMELDMGEALWENNRNVHGDFGLDDMLARGVDWEGLTLDGQVRGSSHSILMKTVPTSQTNATRRRLYAEARRVELEAFERLRIDMVRELLPHYMDEDIHLLHADGVKNTADCGCLPGPSIHTMDVDLMSSRRCERVAVRYCNFHPPALTLLNCGFMPAAVHGINVAFHLANMKNVARYREHGGLPFQTVFEAEFFKSDSSHLLTSERPKFYKEFLVATREYLILRHLIFHGRFLLSIIEKYGTGRTRKLDTNHGGGGNYGIPEVSNAFFKEADSSYQGKEVENSARLKKVCTSKSGGRTEVAAIFGTFCRHEVAGSIYDIDVGRKVSYATSALLEFRQRYPNRKVAFSYDIACKLAPHLEKHGSTGRTVTSFFEILRPKKGRRLLPNSCGLLLAIEGRSILSIRRLLKARQGTTLTSKLRVKLKRHLAELTRLLKEYNSGSTERHQRTIEELALSAREAELAIIEEEGAEAEAQDDDSIDGHEEDNVAKEVDDELDDLNGGPNKLTVKQVLDELELPEHHSDILEYWRNLEDLVLHQTDLDNAADHFHERRKFWTDVERLVNVAADDASANWPQYAQKAAILWIKERSAQEEAIGEAWASLQTYFDISQYHTLSLPIMGRSKAAYSLSLVIRCIPLVNVMNKLFNNK